MPSIFLFHYDRSNALICGLCFVYGIVTCFEQVICLSHPMYLFPVAEVLAQSELFQRTFKNKSVGCTVCRAVMLFGCVLVSYSGINITDLLNLGGGVLSYFIAIHFPVRSSQQLLIYVNYFGSKKTLTDKKIFAIYCLGIFGLCMSVWSFVHSFNNIFFKK